MARIFFTFSKNRLLLIKNTFKRIYGITLVDYIKLKLKKLKEKSNFVKDKAGMTDSYATYLRGILLSIGDRNFCDGNCHIMQEREEARHKSHV
jgi:hypothetical protein